MKSNSGMLSSGFTASTGTMDSIFRNEEVSKCNINILFRLKNQDASNKIEQLECQLRDTKEQLSQQKSQLLELSLMREEEKKNSHRNQQNIINKFKVERCEVVYIHIHL